MPKYLTTVSLYLVVPVSVKSLCPNALYKEDTFGSGFLEKRDFKFTIDQPGRSKKQ